MNTPIQRIAFMALQAAESTYIPPKTSVPHDGISHIATAARPKSTVVTGVRKRFAEPSLVNVSRRNTTRKSPRIISSGNIAPNCE